MSSRERHKRKHDHKEKDRKKHRKSKRDKEYRDEKKPTSDDSLLMGYSNASNPFGDSNLSERFVWKLKKERDAELGHDPRQSEQNRMEELRKELEKAKRRRIEREIEKQREEAERTALAREREGMNYSEWAKQEDKFHLEQARLRSDIRIRDGRAKPIDILYKILNQGRNDRNEGLDAKFIALGEPQKMFLNLDVKEMGELRKEILEFIQIDDDHREFWEALRVVADDEIARKTETKDMKQSQPVHSSVSNDITKIFQGKTFQQLCDLEQKMQKQIHGGNAIDSEYWETVLKRLVVWKSRIKLKEIYESIVQRKLGRAPSRPATSSLQDHKRGRSRGEDVDGRYSPRLYASLEEISGGASISVVDAEEDERLIAAQRARVLERRMAVLKNSQTPRAASVGLNSASEEQGRDTLGSTSLLTEKEMYDLEAERAMEDDEEVFSHEVPVTKTQYAWQEKYRPRKPKYFNRVHTGFEWNKYNQSHYDTDNPPPKIVQGYKFNIFYPDLIDKHSAPRYFIESEGESADTVIIRFHAGPPYEDIAFRIVNREWEYSHKKGFKCVFERGILHLWVNFKRYRYRR